MSIERDRVARIAQMRRNRMTFREIAEAMGMSVARVQHVYTQYLAAANVSV